MTNLRSSEIEKILKSRLSFLIVYGNTFLLFLFLMGGLLIFNRRFTHSKYYMVELYERNDNGLVYFRLLENKFKDKVVYNNMGEFYNDDTSKFTFQIKKVLKDTTGTVLFFGKLSDVYNLNLQRFGKIKIDVNEKNIWAQ